MAASLHRILVVEDETDIQNLLKISLARPGGFEVEVCSDGKQALAAIARHTPDLILMDMNMPTWSGLTVLRVLRKEPQTAAIPVIFLTAQSHEMNQQAQLPGVLGIIPKPFVPRNLISLIQTMWQKATPPGCLT